MIRLGLGQDQHRVASVSVQWSHTNAKEPADAKQAQVSHVTRFFIPTRELVTKTNDKLSENAFWGTRLLTCQSGLTD